MTSESPCQRRELPKSRKPISIEITWIQLRQRDFRIGIAQIFLGSAERAATTGRQQMGNAAGVPTPGRLRIGGWSSKMTRHHANRPLAIGGCRSTMSGLLQRMFRLTGEPPRLPIA
jgi:hypothetical protein